MYPDLENHIALPDHRPEIEPLYRERCAACNGRVYEDGETHEDKHYCDLCWAHLECCTGCGERIFEGEVKDGEDYFHPECMEAR